MDRRRVVRGAFTFVVCALLLPLSGCVPGAIVEWTIAPEHGVSASGQDIERLRRLLNTLGYVKADEDSRSGLGAEFFSFATSQRFNVALLPDANGAIRLKLVEHGEKQLSSMGRRQMTLIADGLEIEFGRNRVVLTQSPD